MPSLLDVLAWILAALKASASDLMVSNQAPILTELKDIELPRAPLADYAWLWQSFSWFLLVILLIFTLFLVLSFFRKLDQPLLLAPLSLRWKLKRIRQQFLQASSDNPSESDQAKLYQWVTHFSRVLNKVENRRLQQSEVPEEVEKLKQDIAFFLFSKSIVSRETFLAQLSHARVLLNKSFSFGFICQCIWEAVQIRPKLSAPNQSSAKTARKRVN